MVISSFSWFFRLAGQFLCWFASLTNVTTGPKRTKASLLCLAGCWQGHLDFLSQSVSSPRRLYRLFYSLKFPRRWKQKLQGFLRPKHWGLHSGIFTTLYWLNQVTRSSPNSKGWRNRWYLWMGDEAVTLQRSMPAGWEELCTLNNQPWKVNSFDGSMARKT